MKKDKKCIFVMSFSSTGGGTDSSPLVTSKNSNGLMFAPIPDTVIGLVRDGAQQHHHQASLPLPPAIVQITEPLSRSALAESGSSSGVSALMSVAGDVSVTPVTLRSNPVISSSAPHLRQHSLGSVTLSKHPPAPASILEEDVDLDTSDFITLSTNNAVVFSSNNSVSGYNGQSQDREVPLDTITLDQHHLVTTDHSDQDNTANTRVIISGSSRSTGHQFSPPTAQHLVSTMSLPVVFTPSSHQTAQFSSSSLSSQESLPPTSALLSPSTISMLPRDQLLSSNINPLPKLMSTTGSKDSQGKVLLIHGSG